MRKNFGKKPWLYPMPVLIVSAYNEVGKPEAMAIGWCGILDTKHISLCAMNYHKTTHAVEYSKAFTASVADLTHIKACDYLGSVSGNDVPDKIDKAHFHTVKSQFVNAPLIEELPVSLECELESYDPESGLMIGRIINVSADENMLDSDGNIDADKFTALTYDPCLNAYRTLGGLVGTATEVYKNKK